MLDGAQRPWGGWLLMDPREVPSAWRRRVVQISLVPLLPEEMGQVLKQEGAFPSVPEEDLPILRFLAAGTPVTHIARETELPLRTVQRRVARYRDLLGVSTTAELSALLARRGF